MAIDPQKIPDPLAQGGLHAGKQVQAAVEVVATRVLKVLTAQEAAVVIAEFDPKNQIAFVLEVETRDQNGVASTAASLVCAPTNVKSN